MKSSVVFLIFSFTVFFSVSAVYPLDKAEDEFIAGKIEFIGKNGKDGIAVITSPEKGYLLNKGTLLYIRRGKDRIILKINDTAGKYLRCIVSSEKGNPVIGFGDDVYYSDSINSGMKYRDAKRIFAEHIRLYENFILKVESTEDTQVLADEIKKLSVELDSLIPEMQRINSRYPELNKKDTPPPVELKGELEMLQALEPRLKDAFFKIQMFSSDQNIKKATEELQKVLAKLKIDK